MKLQPCPNAHLKRGFEVFRLISNFKPVLSKVQGFGRERQIAELREMELPNCTASFEDSIIEEINSLCPCRSIQVEQLISSFGEKSEYSCPCIFVYGHTGTGKNHVLKVIMNKLKVWRISNDLINNILLIFYIF